MISLFTDDPTVRLPVTYDDAITLNATLDSDPNKLYEINSVVIRTVVASTMEPRPMQDGMEAYDARKTSKIIVLDGIIRAPSYPVLWDMINELGRIFDPALGSFNEPVTHGFNSLKFTTLSAAGSKLCMYVCRPVGPPDIQWTEYMGLNAPFRLELMAADPRRYLQTPIVVPFEADGSHVVVNTGEYPSYPVVTLTATGAMHATLQLTNEVYTPDKVITLNLSSITAGQVVKVYFDEKIITVNGTRVDGLILPGPVWWQFKPGSQVVSFSSSTGINIAASNWTFYPAFAQ